MLGTVDFSGIQPDCTDHFLLEVYLQQLVGQPLLHFRFSYGDELTVHFGEPRPYSSAKLKHLIKGSYILGTRASNWYLTTVAPPMVLIGTQDSTLHTTTNLQPLSKQDLESAPLISPGTRVHSATVLAVGNPTSSGQGYRLSIMFTDGAVLRVSPEFAEKPADAENTIADWELLTCHDRYLRAGPGWYWSYSVSRNQGGAPIG